MVIEEEADRLNRLVADLLDLSRLQGGALPVAVELNAVDDLVGAALQRVSHALGARVIRTSLADGGTMLVGRFDLAASLRILVNVLENAIDTRRRRTPIELQAHRTGHTIEIVVADRGAGVAEAMRDRVFEPFLRGAGAAPMPEAPGSGSPSPVASPKPRVAHCNTGPAPGRRQRNSRCVSWRLTSEAVRPLTRPAIAAGSL